MPYTPNPNVPEIRATGKDEYGILKDKRSGEYEMISPYSEWDIRQSELVWSGPASQVYTMFQDLAPEVPKPPQPPQVPKPPPSGPVASPKPTPEPLPTPPPVKSPDGKTTWYYPYPWTGTGQTMEQWLASQKAPGGSGGGGSTGPILSIGGSSMTMANRLGPAITDILRNITGPTGRFTAQHWNSIPSWLKGVLTAVGIQEGADFLLDAITGNAGNAIAVGGVLNNNQVVKTWQAGPTTMGRLADGRMFAVRKDGRTKIWRPKRPVAVIYGDGVAGDVRKLLRADRVLNKEAKSVDALIKRRAKSRNVAKRKKA